MQFACNPAPIPSPADNFRPTPLQFRFLRYIQGDPSYQSITQICQAVGVDPSTYYKWCHNRAFRAWLVREWSSALMFEGWHVLNLARMHMVRSATHFKAIHNLLFEPKGQAALASWQENLVAATTPEVETDPSADQSDSPENSTPGEPPASFPPGVAHYPDISPGKVVQHLATLLKQASAPPPPHPSGGIPKP